MVQVVLLGNVALHFRIQRRDLLQLAVRLQPDRSELRHHYHQWLVHQPASLVHRNRGREHSVRHHPLYPTHPDGSRVTNSDDAEDWPGGNICYRISVSCIYLGATKRRGGINTDITTSTVITTIIRVSILPQMLTDPDLTWVISYASVWT